MRNVGAGAKAVVATAASATSFEMDKVESRNIGDIIRVIRCRCLVAVYGGLLHSDGEGADDDDDDETAWLDFKSSFAWRRHQNKDEDTTTNRSSKMSSWSSVDKRAIIGEHALRSTSRSFIVLPCYLSILFESLTICFAILSRFRTVSL